MDRYQDDEFTAVMNEFGDMVLRICFLRLQNRAEAEDAFQDVFVKLYTHTPIHDKEHLKAWLITVSRNRCISLLRKKRPEPLEDALLMGKTESDKEVLSSVLALEGGDRDVVYLHYFENMTCVEISAALRMNENTVRTRLRRAREKLRRVLSDDEGDEDYEFQRI